jgi:hypothetical protein
MVEWKRLGLLVDRDLKGDPVIDDESGVCCPETLERFHYRSFDRRVGK